MPDKRVLVCSIPCWNNKTGSDTLSSLFSGYDKEKIANIYIRDGVPNSESCKKYFRISETGVIKSILRRNIKTGHEEFNCEENSDDAKNEETLISRAQKGSSNRFFKLLIRELLWFFGKWKSKELIKFVDDFAPEVVFFPMEGYIHFNRLCRYVVKHSGAKAIGYFWDDNFTYKQQKSFLFRFYRFFQRKDLKKSAEICSKLFAITPKTKKEADEVFSVNCSVLTKGIDFSSIKFTDCSPNEPLKIVYAGKLIIGRFDTVVLISNALKKINAAGKKAELLIYTTTELSENQKQLLCDSVHLLGAVPQSHVPEKLQGADVLLFAEALCGKDMMISRLSFSTKLTDYFAAGKCIFAVAPNETAPMEYLKMQDAALCASSADEIETVLRKMCEKPETVREYAKKAFECGYNFHNAQSIKKELFDSIDLL